MFQVFGYLGINGAGKSTTLEMLSGKKNPTSGTAFLSGFPISDQDSIRRHVGYCPQTDPVFEHLTSREHLMMVCARIFIFLFLMYVAVRQN